MAYWVDDAFDTWPETVRAGTAAAGLYLRCGAWISRNTTDGEIPAEVATMYGTREWVQRLVAVGLWAAEGDGYRDVRYFEMGNPTRAQVLERKAAAAKRQADMRARRNPAAYQAGPSRVTHAKVTDDSRITSAVTHASPALPNQNSPSESSSGDAAKPRTTKGTRIPEPFEVTDEMKRWKAANCPDVQGWPETEKFVDYWRSVAGARGVKRDWQATWRNWMRRAQDDHAGASRPGTVVALRGEQQQPRGSTTDQRVGAALALAAKYAEEDA